MSKPSKYPLNHDAFAFLERCGDATFDMTSSRPPHPKESSIVLPERILTAISTVDFDDFSEVKGMSRGEEYVLQECVKFFRGYGIKCEQKHVALNSDILSTMELVYQRIGLSRERKVLVLTPTFGYYFKQFKEMDIGFETFSTKAENNFLPDLDDLEAEIIKSGVVALLLCYPNNPTGAMMTEECARSLIKISTKHNVFIISDEAFMASSLSEQKHFPIAAADLELSRSFTITSPSKSMFTGNKMSFCVGKEDVVSTFEKLGGHSKTLQRILAASIEDTPRNKEYLRQCSEYYLRNIDIITEKLSTLNRKFCEVFRDEKSYVRPFISRPEATNVYLLDFSGLRGKSHNGKIMNSGLDIVEWLLQDAKFAAVPGECFCFDERDMLVRITLNNPPAEIIKAFDGIITAAEKIQNSPAKSPDSPTAEGALATNKAAAR